MASCAVPADPSHPSAITIDAAREREVFRYLEPWRDTRQASSLFQPVSVTATDEKEREDTVPTRSRGCDDTALASFAQLGALRLGVQRCIILLFGREHEYLLAEATRTLSLQLDSSHDSGDALWLGTGCFSKSNGLGEHVLPAWKHTSRRHEPDSTPGLYHSQGQTANLLLVSDMRREQELCDRFLPRFNNDMRFLAAVPLIGTHKRVIGSYVVVDSIPRYGISEQEFDFMEDMAETVVNHLIARRAMIQKRRAERLIQGLGHFSQGGDSLRAWWLGDREMEDRRGRRQQKLSDDLVLSPTEQADREMGKTFTVFDGVAQTAPDYFHHDDPITGQHLLKDKTNEEGNQTQDAVPPANPAKTPLASNAPQFDVRRATANILSRASNLIREAMDADGVLFLDAGFNQTRAQRKSSSIVSASTSTSGISMDGTSDSNDMAEQHRADALDSDASVDLQLFARRKRKRQPDPFGGARCKALAFSTKAGSSLRGFDAPKIYGMMKQQRMIKLLERYPEGRVFNFAKDGTLLSGSGTDSTVNKTDPLELSAERKRRVSWETAALARVCDDARSIAFIPIWDSHRGKWRCGALIWTSMEGKFLSRDDDLPYLSAFMNCTMGELDKLDTMDSDQAKATFISCISHELRSPLHGVLAGSDFVLDTDLDTFQRDMMMTIKTAGTTLMETINSILEYSKMNPVDSGRSQQLSFGGEFSNDIQSMNLAASTEDVINSIIAGRSYHFDSHGSIDPVNGDPLTVSHRGNLQIVLDIIKQHSWHVYSSPASWAKIVYNIVSNAVKFTASGLIHVTLDYVDGKAMLAVKDTGSGISKEFREHYLYSAFRQENTLSPGTGLGLFIVKRLIDELGGSIDISSNNTKNTGTAVVVEVRVGIVPPEERHSESHQHDLSPTTADGHPPRIRLVSSPLTLHASSVNGGPDTSSKIRTCVERTCAEWLDVEFERADSFATSDQVDLHLILESEYRHYIEQKQDRAWRRDTKYLVIAETLSSSQSLSDHDDTSNFKGLVNGPFGPRGLAEAFKLAMSECSTPPLNGRLALGPRKPTMKNTRTMISGPASRKSSLSQPLEDSIRAKKVLLVEDNEINMKLLVAWTKKLGLPFVMAINGLEAVRAYTFDPRSFSLVLMDISMPVMDGLTATNEIRKHERLHHLDRCKIVALTGVATAEAQADAKAAGVDMFIAKPASFQRLYELVTA